MAKKNDLIAPSSLDIANSDKWDENDWFVFFRDRYAKMRSKHFGVNDDTDGPSKFDRFETQVNSVSVFDNTGMLVPNIPLEKTLMEIYMGRTEGKINFDIVPDGEANIQELEPTKYAMSFFMDGNGKDNFWKENKLMRSYKAMYGSGIFFTGIRRYRDTRYVLKDDIEIENDTDILKENNFEKKVNETWFLFPKAIHPNDFFIDDNAVGQSDVQYAEDCIMKERVSFTELKNRYQNSSTFNLEGVTYFVDDLKRNKDDQSVDNRFVILYHYYHRLTKKYMIVANLMNIIYNGLYLYDDGKLPFVNVQHYTNPNRFIGEGIPERVAYLKAYKSEVFHDMLSGSAMSSGIHLLTGNDDQIDQNWTVGGRQMNIWRTTGGVENVRPIGTSPNLSYFQAVLSTIDKQIAMDSGINPMEQIEPSSDKVGIVEIMEANKSVRNASVDENYNIGLDEALTMMLSRVQQFAPALLKEDIKDSNGKTIKSIFPKIRIENYKVENKDGQQVFTESIGKYGYFELKPEIVRGIGVKIVTPSTNSALPILERQKITEYINNFMQIAQVAQMDPTGQSLQKLMQSFRLDQVMEWMGDAYGYDMQNLKASTDKDKIMKENLQKIDSIKQMLSFTPPQNAGNNPQPTSTPSALQNPNQTSGGFTPGMGSDQQAGGTMAGKVSQLGTGNQALSFGNQ